MKRFLMNLLFLLYSMVSLGILLGALGLVFTLGMKDAPPNYVYWIDGILAIIVCASQGQVFEFFIKQNML